MRDFGRELTSAAADIENSLTGLRCEKLPKVRPEAPNERVVVLITGCIP